MQANAGPADDQGGDESKDTAMALPEAKIIDNRSGIRSRSGSVANAATP